MNSFPKDRNINFMVFENQNSIDDYLSYEIIKHIKSKRDLNLAIESRTSLFSLMNNLRDQCLNGKVSFSNIKFFMVDDFVFELSSWENFLDNSSENVIKNVLFSDTDFVENNFYRLIDFNRFNSLLDGPLNSYDAQIDAHNGLDILVLKINSSGSLIFNEFADSIDLSSKAFNLTTSLKKQISSEFKKTDFLPVVGATLGIDQILKTRKIYVVINDASSANILQKMFYSKDYDKTLPACLLKSHPNVVVLTDKAASAGIFNPIETTFNSHYPTTNLPARTEIARDYAYEKNYYRNQANLNNVAAGYPNNNQQVYEQVPYDQLQSEEFNQPGFGNMFLEPTDQSQMQEVVEPMQTEEVLPESPMVEPVNQNINIIIGNEGYQSNPNPVEAQPAVQQTEVVQPQQPAEESVNEDYDFDSLNDFQDID